jgi:hypothetical protein
MNTPLLVQLSWTAVVGATEYRIYKRSPNSDWVLLTTVLSPTTHYDYDGVEGVNYIFGIRSWDGFYESDVATVNYPYNLTSMWQTPLNTPDGMPMVTPIDVQYVTKEEFIKSPIAKGLGYTATSEDYLDGTIDQALLAASVEVNRYCNRYFNKQTIDEMMPDFVIQVSNPQMTVVPLHYGPVQAVNTIDLQVLKWFITFSLEYLNVFPEQHLYKIVPMISSSGNTGMPIPSVLLEQSTLSIVWTNYTFGYDVIPEDIKHAVKVLAGYELALSKQNPMGAISIRTGTMTLSFAHGVDNPIATKAYGLLDRWKTPTLITT